MRWFLCRGFVVWSCAGSGSGLGHFLKKS